MGVNPSPEFWAGQRVLLTGHTGFKGAWASLWLERLGAEVHGFALAPDQVPDLFGKLAPFAGATSTLGDLGDAAALGRAIDEARPTIVLHMAAQPLVRRSYAKPAETFATNVMGTVNVLDALRSSPDLRAVLVVTTDKVYRNDAARAFVESDALGGHDPYSASKACAELVTAAYAGYFEVPVASARAGNVVGGGDWALDRLVPDAWRAAQAGLTLALRYPDATRPWQHVLDALAGYLIYLEHLAGGAAVPRALNFGPSHASASVADVASAVTAGLGAGPGWRQAPGDHPVEAATLALDPSAAAAALGWRTRLDAAQTVAWTADWYRRFDAGEAARTLCAEQVTAFENLAAEDRS